MSSYAYAVDHLDFPQERAIRFLASSTGNLYKSPSFATITTVFSFTSSGNSATIPYTMASAENPRLLPSSDRLSGRISHPKPMIRAVEYKYGSG